MVVKNNEDIKRAETVAMVDKMIDKLMLFKQQVVNDSVTIEDISINQRLRSQLDEAVGIFNMNIDIDYVVRPDTKIKTK
ncbi:hypothetical protein M4I17_13245 [Enterococcus thailandicus]|uniref:hypothetical protein n=1 Tax=Enterococcus thailandicus TaxID=417368 RepID=UPI002543E197|nr:hypothetical protein [Enterococcus thailandicus]MDK4353357.1 hypothetical protein [Enterococcus thailandicus]